MTLTMQPKDFTWLSQAFQDKSLMSPFTYIQEKDFTEEDRQRLIAEGVIGEDSAVKEAYLLLLQSLCQVSGYLNVTVREASLSMKKSYLYTVGGPVSMLPMKESLLIRQPSDSGQTKVALANLLGSSKISNLDLSVTLTVPAMQVVAGIIDLQRERDLKSVLEGDDRDKGFISIDALTEFLSVDVKNRHAIRGFLSEPVLKDAAAIESTLKQLEDEGCIEKDEKGISLHGDWEAFANRFLINDKIITLEMGQEKNEEVYGAKIMIAQSGVNDLFLIQEAPEAITFYTISATQAQTLVNGLIASGPDLV